MDDSPHTVRDCLKALGIATQDDADRVFGDCDGIDEEFTAIKKVYFAKILREHPDKGGDAAQFRRTQAAFDVLRTLKAGGGLSSYYADEGGGPERNVEESYEEFFRDAAQGATPSYEYYYEAAQEEVPGYKVELAKSGRSQCVKCKPQTTCAGPKKKKDIPLLRDDKGEDEGAVLTTKVQPKKTQSKPFIPQGAIRVGSLDENSGSYGRWNHLACWRVPYRVWGGITNPDEEDQVYQDLSHMEEILLTNFGNLPPEAQREVVRHVMDRNHWARKTKGGRPPPDMHEIRNRQKEEFEATEGAADKKKSSPIEEGENMEENRDARFECTNKEATATKQAAGQPIKREKTRDVEKKPTRAKEPATSASAAAKNDAGEDQDAERRSKSSSSTAKEVKKTTAKKESTKASKKRALDNETASVPSEVAKRPKMNDSTNSNAIVPKKKKPSKTKFVIPRPGVDGAQPGCYEGKRFVLTGIFPEVGGGSGLNLGKDRVKGLIESFGGRVTSALSGLTSFLVVGKQPGASKVMQAKAKGVPLIDLKTLKERIMGEINTLENVQPPAITEFSAGYVSSGMRRIGY